MKEQYQAGNKKSPWEWSNFKQVTTTAPQGGAGNKRSPLDRPGNIKQVINVTHRTGAISNSGNTSSPWDNFKQVTATASLVEGAI